MCVLSAATSISRATGGYPMPEDVIIILLCNMATLVLFAAYMACEALL